MAEVTAVEVASVGRRIERPQQRAVRALTGSLRTVASIAHARASTRQ